VFAGVGERTREGNDFYHEMIGRVSSTKTRCRNSKVAMVYGQMNGAAQSPACALTGLTMAEYFRDEVREDGGKGRDVLFFRGQYYRYTSPARKCRRSWVACPPRGTAQLAEEMGVCRNASPPPRPDPSPRFRPCTCPRTDT